jgi:hypothetical protein
MIQAIQPLAGINNNMHNRRWRIFHQLKQRKRAGDVVKKNAEVENDGKDSIAHDGAGNILHRNNHR